MPYWTKFALEGVHGAQTISTNVQTACLDEIQYLYGYEHALDTLAERLRRRPAKPMGSARVGSNPTGVVFEILVCNHERRSSLVTDFLYP